MHMTFDKAELLILLESINNFYTIDHDTVFTREITELREKIRRELVKGDSHAGRN